MLLGYAHLNQYPIIASLYDFLPSEAASVVAAYLRHVSSIQLGPMMLAILFACLWFPMRATNSLITAIRKGMGKRPTPPRLPAQPASFAAVCRVFDAGHCIQRFVHVPEQQRAGFPDGHLFPSPLFTPPVAPLPWAGTGRADAPCIICVLSERLRQTAPALL